MIGSGKYNVGVIQLPLWRVLCFVDASGSNIVREWLYRERIPAALKGELQGRIDLIEAGGPRVVPGCIEEIKGSSTFCALRVERKGFGVIRPVFCYGPFGEREMTLLVGVPDKTNGVFKPSNALRLAQQNLAALMSDPSGRKRYERIT